MWLRCEERAVASVIGDWRGADVADVVCVDCAGVRSALGLGLGRGLKWIKKAVI